MASLLKTVLAVVMAISISGCGEKSAVDNVMGMVERCWGFIDESDDFPSRSLSWVGGTENETYERRSIGLRVEYAGEDTDRVDCKITNEKADWSQIDRDAVFEAMTAAAPEWISSRYDSNIEDVEIDKTAEDGVRRQAGFTAEGCPKINFSIQESAADNLVTILFKRRPCKG